MSEPKSARGATTRPNILDFLAAPLDSMPRLIVLFGREHVLADDAVRTIVERAVPDLGMRALNVDTVDAAAIERAGDVSAKLATLPFLADRRVVVMRGSIDLKKEDREAIVSAAADVPEHAVLVVDHAGRPSRPQGRKPKDEAAAIAAGTPRAVLLECALDARECERYIDGVAAHATVKIDADARAALAATEDVAEISNALARLALTTKRIRLADVRDYAVPARDVKLWDLADAVARRDAASALRLARDFAESPIGPLQWLAGDAQVVWELCSGTRSDEYARATGQNSWRIAKLTGAARQIAPAHALRNVEITMKALERCITGKRDGAQTLDEVIIRLCEKPK
ncbi:MAG TPA: hypothetical protein VEJ20_09585 [Candidatus Eremiobacteraceae bacterium]|nr:hypothetical protein [Candidatus Eremiobacteraceae bacterium]